MLFIDSPLFMNEMKKLKHLFIPYQDEIIKWGRGWHPLIWGDQNQDVGIYIVNIDAACLLLRIDAKVSGDVVIGLC